MKHLMIDLEAMGTKPNGAIVAIGAVYFDETGLGEEFYARVDLQSALDWGGTIDPATVLWWMQQSEEARKEIWNPIGIIGVREALENFDVFANSNKLKCVWGNGADFDNIILGEAYARCGLVKPWSYAQNRCFRTLRYLYKDIVEAPKRKGVHHNALDDAKFQAEWASMILRFAKSNGLA
jgi:hypothetical protein